MVSARNVDFSNVKEGGSFNRSRIPSGDYLAVISKIEDAEAKDGIFQYLVSIKLKKRTQSVFPYYCKLQENQLWKLRNLLIAGGLTVPKKRIKVDPTKLIGKLIGVTIEDDEYDGKEQSQIVAVFPAAELDDEAGDVSDTDDDDDEESEDEDEAEEAATEDDAEEEEEAAEEEPEAEDEPEEEEAEGDEYDAMERLDLRKALQKLDPSIKTTKAQSDDDIRDIIRGLVNSDDEAEEEEEAPAPVIKKKPAAKKPAAKKAADVTDEELEELDIDDL